VTSAIATGCQQTAHGDRISISGASASSGYYGTSRYNFVLLCQWFFPLFLLSAYPYMSKNIIIMMQKRCNIYVIISYNTIYTFFYSIPLAPCYIIFSEGCCAPDVPGGRTTPLLAFGTTGGGLLAAPNRAARELGFKIWKEHNKFSSTDIIPPALSNSPQ